LVIFGHQLISFYLLEFLRFYQSHEHSPQRTPPISIDLPRSGRLNLAIHDFLSFGLSAREALWLHCAPETCQKAKIGEGLMGGLETPSQATRRRHTLTQIGGLPKCNVLQLFQSKRSGYSSWPNARLLPIYCGYGCVCVWPTLCVCVCVLGVAQSRSGNGKTCELLRRCQVRNLNQ